MSKHRHYTLITSSILSILLIAFAVTAVAQDTQSREYGIKATFLYHFTRFVEWPAASFPGPESPFVIGILGSDPFGNVLNEVVKGEKVKGHPIIIQRYSRVSDINHCHILYINLKNETDTVKSILQQLPRNILTVSDHPDFSTSGGMIRLNKVNDKIKLVINAQAAKAGDLLISSKLLSLAEIYPEPGN